MVYSFVCIGLVIPLLVGILYLFEKKSQLFTLRELRRGVILEGIAVIIGFALASILQATIWEHGVYRNLFWTLIFFDYIFVYSFTVSLFCRLQSANNTFLEKVGLFAGFLCRINHFEQIDEDCSWKQKFLCIMVPFTGLFYMICMFGDCESYYGNYNEWLFRADVILIPAIIIVVCTVLISLLLAVVLHKQLAEELSLALAGIFVAAYLQNALMNQDLFIEGIRQEISPIVLIANSIFWFILIIVPIVIYRTIKARDVIVKVATIASLFLLIMQLVPLPMLLLSKHEQKVYQGTEMLLDGTDQFSVSSDENVIVFVMDTMSADFFDQYIEKYEDDYTFLKDFTYFDNVNTNAYYTPFSMPCLLTSSDIDFSMSI